jgi:hypothetical protein
MEQHPDLFGTPPRKSLIPEVRVLFPVGVPKGWQTLASAKAGRKAFISTDSTDQQIIFRL